MARYLSEPTPYILLNNGYVKGCFNTPLEHTRQSPKPIMKEIPLEPFGKGLGVCSKGVLKQPLIMGCYGLIFPLFFVYILVTEGWPLINGGGRLLF